MKERAKVEGFAQHTAKPVELAVDALDTFSCRSGLKPHLRYGTYINLLSGAAAIIGPAAMNKTPTTSRAACFFTSLGWHLTTKLEDYILEYLGIPVQAKSKR